LAQATQKFTLVPPFIPQQLVISPSQGTFPEKELLIICQELASILSYLGPHATGPGCQFAMWLLIQL